MRGSERPGTVHWIDHYVVCTNDVDRWEAFHSAVQGAVTAPHSPTERARRGIFQDIGVCRHGGFVTKTPLPPTKGLGKGLPRHAHYIHAADIDAHLRRLDKAGAPHSDPVRSSADGEDGIAIYWQDPDGNQFEFWAPEVLPEGAMAECGPERIGRISHSVVESRDLDRTAAFFDRYCALEPLNSADIAADRLVLPLAAGGKLVFHKVDKLQGRTAGFGLPYAHVALVVRSEDFLPNYKRMWAELPEWDFDLRGGKTLENPEALPARTALHGSQAGHRFKEITGRGDDWYDWDSNQFHFFGSMPLGDSLTFYKGRSMQYFLDQWESAEGGKEGLRTMVQA
jgi:predicted enzyme related to lactoylglutathione lyase